MGVTASGASVLRIHILCEICHNTHQRLTSHVIPVTDASSASLHCIDCILADSISDRYQTGATTQLALTPFKNLILVPG